MKTSHPPLEMRRVPLAGGITLEVAERGPRDGPCVLMLHGITDAWRSFEPLLPYLPPHWHLVLPSQRGHGGSDRPPHGYRTRDFADDVVQLAQALELPPLLLVGHSMGAANAMRVAIDHPERVSRLVAAGAFARFSDKPELVDFIEDGIEPLRDPISRALADEFQRSTVVQPVPESLLQAMVDESLRAPAHVWREAFRGLLEDDFSAELQQLLAPTLLICGGRDAYVPAGDVQRLLQAIPDVRAQHWRNAGHAMHWEEPQRFAASLIDFAGDGWR